MKNIKVLWLCLLRGRVSKEQYIQDSGEIHGTDITTQVQVADIQQ